MFWTVEFEPASTCAARKASIARPISRMTAFARVSSVGHAFQVATAAWTSGSASTCRIALGWPSAARPAIWPSSVVSAEATAAAPWTRSHWALLTTNTVSTIAGTVPRVSEVEFVPVLRERPGLA